MKEVDGVHTVLVLDQDIDAGQVGEASIDYLAQDKSGNIWYLGSYTEITRAASSSTLSTPGLPGRKAPRRVSGC